MYGFTAWVTGPTAQSNREGIEAIIRAALDWETRSGATFNPEACLVGQLAFWLFFRWQAETNAAEPFPDFSRLELWYRTKVIRRGKADYTGQLSYATAHKWALDFYSMCSIRTGKATHAPRVAAAQNADMAGVSDAQVSKASGV